MSCLVLTFFCVVFVSCIMCLCLFFLYFFFFKQNAAYDMRISDWSSDVCSSDLRAPDRCWAGHITTARGASGRLLSFPVFFLGRTSRIWRHSRRGERRYRIPPGAALCLVGMGRRRAFLRHLRVCRSEEHTSELQSLMRISYAVFCLKKKKNNTSKKQN